MDMRYDMRGDGRRLPPRNARGEFRRRRGRGRDRGMEDMRGGDYGYDMRGYDMRGQDYGDYAGDMARGGGRGGSRGGQGGGRGRSDRGYDMGDYGYGDRGDMRGMDGHYMHGGQSMGGQTYYPIEAMGRFNGYWGMPEQDFARRDMGYRNYDMRGGRDYGYEDYGYPVGDFGESLSEKELHEWCEQMKKHLSEQEKQMLSEQAIIQKAKQMGMSMDGFTEKELYVNTVRNYTDHKKSIGQNPDLALRMAYEDFHDEDGEYNGKGSQWLAVYYDNFVKVDD